VHVLTKIFIVLVALLAVFLVPLIVVYAHNENSFKARFEQAASQAQVAQANLQEAEARHGATEARLSAQIESIRQRIVTSSGNETKHWSRFASSSRSLWRPRR
jgi:F0F1-type ATP synthase membrane subunit b/b'